MGKIQLKSEALKAFITIYQKNREEQRKKYKYYKPKKQRKNGRLSIT